MSIDAIRWAWQQEVPTVIDGQTIQRSSMRILLVSLADRAGETAECFPSINRLSDDTCLNRKTVMHYLTLAEKAGFLTAKKTHGSVTFYQLNGVQDRRKTSTAQGTSTVNGTSTTSGTPTSTADGTPPVPPTGHEPSLTLNEPKVDKPPRKKRKPKPEITIDEFKQKCEEAGEEYIPIDDRVFGYAEEIALPRPFLYLCWREFVERNREDGKKQKSWRQTFRNCVRGNWYRLWYIDNADGNYYLTTTGKQAKKKHGEAA